VKADAGVRCSHSPCLASWRIGPQVTPDPKDHRGARQMLARRHHQRRQGCLPI